MKGSVSPGECGVLSDRKGQQDDLLFRVQTEGDIAERLRREIAQTVEGVRMTLA